MDCDNETDLCEKLHEDAEVLYRRLLTAFPDSEGV
ncbi:Rop family plasmid primer RNA-binding protein [Rosenbergiella australiborealis]|uniref:Rop family plasmid primer RNA-binding protein n=1 Tax=Rosenbergiella australiborealis TaxID=1544696 RepID=A0ABS5T828_9GAMM|nr:Rop family plasmid primer RNA-binding protein [Rosenbergiella australiborealis]MBT0728530.1 Rop family plasmid primer RNA-binding protein [Rosenbergiella australiborealis]